MPIAVATCTWEEKPNCGGWPGDGVAVTDGEGTGWKKTDSNGGDYSCCKTDATKCKAFCDAISSCRAYGVSDSRGCWLWKTPPTLSEPCYPTKDQYFGVKTCAAKPTGEHNHCRV